MAKKTRAEIVLEDIDKRGRGPLGASSCRQIAATTKLGAMRVRKQLAELCKLHYVQHINPMDAPPIPAWYVITPSGRRHLDELREASERMISERRITSIPSLVASALAARPLLQTVWPVCEPSFYDYDAE